VATQEQLQQARDALHKLQIGRSVVSVSQDGVTTTYTQANIASLRAYVSSLEVELGVTATRRLPPAGVY
jgi:hypothetical protein